MEGSQRRAAKASCGHVGVDDRSSFNLSRCQFPLEISETLPLVGIFTSRVGWHRHDTRSFKCDPSPHLLPPPTIAFPHDELSAGQAPAVLSPTRLLTLLLDPPPPTAAAAAAIPCPPPRGADYP